MLFPTDPDKRPELWAAFADKVTKGAITFVVHHGEKLPDENRQARVLESVDAIIHSFRSADVVRFGASRGYAIGPFFAFKLEAGLARLVEYAVDGETQMISGHAMQEALQSVAINLFFEKKEIARITFPLALSEWEANEWEVVTKGSETVLCRRAAEV